ncbi:DUF7344 domain-containing protein [Haloarchaeobius amylolyticus]|uniref:DUF7344 domain-containing protein n=1 Tax=Haloarchaeobius amylolyticus TaxID=1198296 RepID=UPI002270DD3A|nr:hypothetical protein [Haloarchaeobius amylolyticus]
MLGDGGSTSGDGHGERRVTRDDVLEALGNERRRFALYALCRAGEQVTLRDLAETVASWENEKPPDELHSQELRRVKNALRQFHLPKLASSGIVEFDERRGTVAVTPEATECDLLTTVLFERRFPWTRYLLTLVGVGTLCAVGGAFEITPFDALPPETWLLMSLAAVLVALVRYCYEHYYRPRRGPRGPPIELRHQ